MALSEIEICNMALAYLGSAPIRSYDEDTKRSRMCQILFEPTRDGLLRLYDWSFARAFATLPKIDTTDMDIPEGMNLFGLPDDYLMARDLHPLGSDTPWSVMGEMLMTPLPGAGLYYTRKENIVHKFSSTFVSALAIALAYKLAPSISQDEGLAKALYEQYKLETAELSGADMNEGNCYRDYDSDPEFDSFVTGESVNMHNRNRVIVEPEDAA